MQNLPILIYTCSAYLILALVFQILFFSKLVGKFFGKHEAVINLFRKPMVFSMWVIAAFFVIENSLHYINYHNLDGFTKPFKTCMLIIAFAIGVHAYKSHYLKLYMKRNPLNQDAHVINGIDKLLSVAIFIIAFLLILDALGFESGPLLAFGGVGAAAVGFAGKDVISNFFGGFMLVISRPFGHGDNIMIPERKIDAHVVHVGWYMTTLKDKDKRFIYIPNSAFVNAFIINASRRSHRKIDTSFQLQSSDKKTALHTLDLIRSQLETYIGLDTALPSYASLQSCDYNTFAIKITAFTEIKEEREFFRFQDELILSLCETVKSAGMKLQDAQYILTNIDS